jgi:hypothetical protein
MTDSGSEGVSFSHKKLIVAISSRALFNLDESHAVFEKDGVEAYCRYQIQHEDIPLETGVAFSLVRKLLALNERDPENPRVEVIEDEPQHMLLGAFQLYYLWQVLQHRLLTTCFDQKISCISIS